MDVWEEWTSRVCHSLDTHICYSNLTTTFLEALWRSIIKAKGQATNGSLAGKRSNYACFLFCTPENMWARRTNKVASVPENRVSLSLLKPKF